MSQISVSKQRLERQQSNLNLLLHDLMGRQLFLQSFLHAHATCKTFISKMYEKKCLFAKSREFMQ